jgi:hypothetical protein
VRSMGDDDITAAMGTPIMAIAAFRLHMVSTRSCTQNMFAACHSGVADRTMRPITDQFRPSQRFILPKS